ncbi:MAG: NUDIX domain-containing protein [Bauldia sp.]|nr:MAG: NUDIX domain-containing protein [Bauldia sp.]
MAERSAGILMYRRTTGALEVFLVHPGGPFWMRKDDGAWSIPKGLFDAAEDPGDAARREFAEETGFAADMTLVALGDFAQPSRKVITAFAVEGDLDPAGLRSSAFEMEWPPKSGRMRSFPEVDRGAWFDPGTAARKLLPGQRPILEALLARLADEDA